MSTCLFVTLFHCKLWFCYCFIQNSVPCHLNPRSVFLSELRQAAERVVGGQAELATLCQRYTELRTTVDQRLRWAVGANPGLKEVADQFNCEQQVRIVGIKI